MSKNTIIIDSGHGGSDSGAVGNGFLEKTLNLSIAKELNNFLMKDSNYNPVMTRTSDVAMTVDARWGLGNKNNPDLLISIHFNSAAGTAGEGFEVYPHVPKESYYAESLKFAELLTKNMSDIQKMRGINGVKFCYLVNGSRQFAESNDINKNNYSTYYGVVRNSKCPAVLVETAFINNPTDISKFNTETKQKIAAARYYRAICEYFGTKPLYDAYGQLIGASQPTSKTLYKVQVGAFSGRSNALNFKDKVVKMGLQAFVVEPTTDKFYRVQVGSFSVKENADLFLDSVKKSDPSLKDAYVIKA